MMKKISYKLNDEAKKIFIGSSLDGYLLNYLTTNHKNVRKKGIIFSDVKLKSKALDLKKKLLKKGHEINVETVVAHEKLKEFNNLGKLYEKLVKHNLSRDSYIISMGGGTIGDVIGLISSTFMRGITWINIPTTLLSQVDSAVGGKTGVNFQARKNLIGTFFHPDLVLIDILYLNSLKKKEIVSGLGEIIKYGLILDQKLYDYTIKNINHLFDLDQRVSLKIIEKCINYKMRIVELDQFDKKGKREVLNFGHTLGHAIEKITSYKVPHGQAVLWGIKYSVLLSKEMNLLSDKKTKSLLAQLDLIKLPKIKNHPNFNELYRLMLGDKKNKKGQIRFVLLKGIGVCMTGIEVDKKSMLNAFKQFNNRYLL